MSASIGSGLGRERPRCESSLSAGLLARNSDPIFKGTGVRVSLAQRLLVTDPEFSIHVLNIQSIHRTEAIYL